MFDPTTPSSSTEKGEKTNPLRGLRGAVMKGIGQFFLVQYSLLEILIKRGVNGFANEV